jgi:hypothetical protein
MFPSNAIAVWTVYRDPLDYPNLYVIRPHWVFQDRIEIHPIGCIYTSLRELMDDYAALGYLTWLDRFTGDEQQIVGTWV